MTENPYDKGGVIPPALTREVLHPDTCLQTRHSTACVRADHPTATSECANAGTPPPVRPDMTQYGRGW